MCLSIWLPLPSLRKYIFKVFFFLLLFFFCYGQLHGPVSVQPDISVSFGRLFLCLKNWDSNLHGLCGNNSNYTEKFGICF